MVAALRVLPEGLGLGKCRHGGGGTVGVMEYHGVDEKDEGVSGDGAPAASRKMRARTWLTASTLTGTGMCGR
jgi:hypothetical protein